MYSVKAALFKRSFWRRMLALFSLSSVAFAFQACYGIETDMYFDVQISGRVTALDTGKPIEGISVSLKDAYSEGLTDSSGYYMLYAPLDSTYVMIYADIDSSLHGSFYSSKKQVTNKQLQTIIEADMSLTRKN